MDDKFQEHIAIKTKDDRVFYAIINSKRSLQAIAEFFSSDSKIDGHFESYLDYGKYKKLEIDTDKVAKIIYYYSVNHQLPQNLDFRFVPIVPNTI